MSQVWRTTCYMGYMQDWINAWSSANVKLPTAFHTNGRASRREGQSLNRFSIHSPVHSLHSFTIQHGLSIWILFVNITIMTTNYVCKHYNPDNKLWIYFTSLIFSMFWKWMEWLYVFESYGLSFGIIVFISKIALIQLHLFVVIFLLMKYKNSWK